MALNKQRTLPWNALRWLVITHAGARWICTCFPVCTVPTGVCRWTVRPFGPWALCFMYFILWSKERVWPLPILPPALPHFSKFMRHSELSPGFSVPLFSPAVVPSTSSLDSLSFTVRAPDVRQMHVPSIGPSSNVRMVGLLQSTSLTQNLLLGAKG